MIEIKNKTKCCGCSACFNVCPTNAIEMAEDEYGFKYPVVNKEKCINCGLCEKKCPILNKKEKNNNTPKSYACYNKDENIREKSSSGGIFSLFAEYILDKGGVVFGAAFNSKNIVEHIYIDNREDLYKLRTSKYVQSTIGNTYKEVKKFLDNGRYVLFTGTPCQVNGLFSYLGKEYENLYTQDFICHGVPSPKVWRKYLKYRKNQDNQEPININFRDKSEGWENFSLAFEYKKGSYRKDLTEDLYMKAFLREACLRDSCYKCFFKEKNRRTDVTIADFWGIQNLLPELNDNKGVSLLIVNTDKGEKLKKSIDDKIICKETEFEKSIIYNISMYTSVEKPRSRKNFFKNLDNMEFDELVKKYTVISKLTFRKKVIRKLKKILKKVLKAN